MWKYLIIFKPRKVNLKLTKKNWKINWRNKISLIKKETMEDLTAEDLGISGQFKNCITCKWRKQFITNFSIDLLGALRVWTSL